MSKTVDNLRKRLVSDMGFSDKKALVYLSLLELGETTAGEVAKNAQIKRTTVYNIIPELLHEGLIHKYKSGKKTLFHINNTTDLLSRIDEKKSGIEKIIPELNKLQMSNLVRPKITQYEGQNGIIQLYTDMLASMNSGEELLSVIGANYDKDIMPYHVLEHYSKERVQKKIKHRIIGTNNHFILALKEKDRDELREIRIIDEGNELTGSDIRIFSNKVAMLSFKDGFIGVIIESEDLYKLNKIMFERVWKTLES